MTTFQIIMFALAAVLVMSTFWDKISEWFANFNNSPKPAPQPAPRPVPVEPDYPPRDEPATLLDIVSCWENLKHLVDSRKNLTEAAEQLDAIFPLFVKEDDNV